MVRLDTSKRLASSGAVTLSFWSKIVIMPMLSGKNSSIEADDIIMIDLASHYQNPLKEKIELIKTAIQNNQHISFLYYYKKGETLRQRLLYLFGVKL